MPNANDLKNWHNARMDQVLSHTIDVLEYWIRHYCENKSYISFSGGLGSSVVIDIVERFVIPRIKKAGWDPIVQIVFVDTGLEYPEVRKHALSKATIILKPKMTFVEVIKKYGYPCISKAQAMAIRKIRTQNLSEKYRNKLLHGDEKGKAGKLSEKNKYLLKADFDISEICCNVIKKAPIYEFEKRNDNEYFGRGITGEMAEESAQRKSAYFKYSCNMFNAKRPKSMALAPWSTQHLLEYASTYKVVYPSVYGKIRQNTKGKYYTTGEHRTGCMFCMFGIGQDGKENRFQRMQVTHPKQYDYCLRGGKYIKKCTKDKHPLLGINNHYDPKENKTYYDSWVPSCGLGMKKVLDTMGIPYEKQISIEDLMIS